MAAMENNDLQRQKCPGARTSALVPGGVTAAAPRAIPRGSTPSVAEFRLGARDTATSSTTWYCHVEASTIADANAVMSLPMEVR